MNILAIIFLVLLGLIVVLGSIRQRKLFLNKWIILLAGVALIVAFAFGGDDDTPAQADMPHFQEIAPPPSYAPYYVQTSSRAYYVVAFDDQPDTLTLINFYYYDKKRWEFSETPLPLNRNIYGNLTVIKRYIGGT